jgi:UDP:flavonoid glycosyltransferase YjiC (YdhE family)
VHHGGSGTMLGALSSGVPQLVLPQGADQFINAAALAASGAGHGLDAATQAPGAVGAAVADLLGPGPARAAAERLRDEIGEMPSPAEVVPALEAIAEASPRWVLWPESEEAS